MTREILSGELEYRIRYDVEHDLFHAQNVFDDEYIKPTFIVYVQKLEAQIEKMRCCNNCSYKHCDCSSQGIDPDGNHWFHNWNEEKEGYCDTGKGKFARYQLWEITE